MSFIWDLVSFFTTLVLNFGWKDLLKIMQATVMSSSGVITLMEATQKSN